jgi:hypothetical protein
MASARKLGVGMFWTVYSGAELDVPDKGQKEKEEEEKKGLLQHIVAHRRYLNPQAVTDSHRICDHML